MTGEHRADEAKNEESRGLFAQSSIPNKGWHQQGQNIGYYLNRFDMLDYMGKNYDAFLAMEDDVIVSSHMVRVVRQLLDQFGNDPRVGLINPGQMMLCRPEDRDKNWDAVTINEGRTTRLCIDAMTAETWHQIEPNYRRYGEIIAITPYHNIGIEPARDAVAAWARSLGSDLLEVSGDTALLRAILLIGKQRLFTIVNRATNIGDYGLNCTPAILAQLGDGHQPIYEDEPDIQEFRVI